MLKDMREHCLSAYLCNYYDHFDEATIGIHWKSYTVIGVVDIRINHRYNGSTGVVVSYYGSSGSNQ